MEIEAIIRQENLWEVIEGFREIDVRGFTVTQAQGKGRKNHATGVHRGKPHTVNLHLFEPRRSAGGEVAKLSSSRRSRCTIFGRAFTMRTIGELKAK